MYDPCVLARFASRGNVGMIIKLHAANVNPFADGPTAPPRDRKGVGEVGCPRAFMKQQKRRVRSAGMHRNQFSEERRCPWFGIDRASIDGSIVGSIQATDKGGADTLANAY